ncbi:AzlD domain-containing protein [Erwiniaceae bacterium CAU 1747]
MDWVLLFTLAAVVFFNRYIFLEPAVPVRLPGIIRDALKYSAPCLLTAICGPIILLNNGELRELTTNPYLYGSLAGVLIALWVRHMIVSVLLCLSVFYLICWMI